MSVPKATLFAAIVVLRVMLPVPSKLTPDAVTSPLRAIVRAVSKAVAVAALPVVSWLRVPTTKSIVPSES